MGTYKSSSHAVTRLEFRDQLRHARIVVGEIVLTGVFIALGVFLVAALVRVWVAW